MTHQIIRTPHGVPSARGYYIQDPCGTAGHRLFPSEQEAATALHERLVG